MFKQAMLTGVVLSAVGSMASAGVVLTSMTYSQNFDNVFPTTTVSGAFSTTAGVQAAIPGTSGWDGCKVSGSSSGTTTTTSDFGVDTGSTNTARVYSYGASGSTERALGSLASGSNEPAFGVAITNNTGAALSKVDISFVREQWRSSTTEQNILTFAWGISSGSVTSSNYLTSSSMTAFSTLNVVGMAAVASNGALDGNATANKANVSGTITFSTPLAVGQTLFLRWQDYNNGGSDAGLAIDNFSANFTAVPEPASMALLALGGLMLAARRRHA